MENLNWLEFNLNAFLWIFIVLNVVNVIIQTIKSIVTINGTPFAAAVINAVTFAIYTVVVVFMNADGLGIIWKALIIGVVNFIGVYIVKWWEEKSRKEKLWKVEATVARTKSSEVQSLLDNAHIPHNYIHAGQYTIFNCYCETKKQSEAIKEILTNHNAKYFVSETKML
jgi:hypothetical protein